MKRKLIASLLCLCMLVSLLPVAAFANDEAGNATTTPFTSATETAFAGKKASDIQSGTVNITKSATSNNYEVSGITLKKIDWKAFNESLEAEQSGYYLAFAVSKTFGNDEIKGMILPGKDAQGNPAEKKYETADALNAVFTDNSNTQCDIFVHVGADATAVKAKTFTIKLKYGSATNYTDYVIDCSKVNVETPTVTVDAVPANLTAVEGQKAPAFGQASTYTAAFNATTKTQIDVTATDLKKTTNTQSSEAYWVGVGLTKQEGATYAWGFGNKPANLKDTDYKTVNRTQTTNEKTYTTLYWSTDDKTNPWSEKTGYISVKVGDKDTDYTVKFDVTTFSNVAIKGMGFEAVGSAANTAINNKVPTLVNPVTDCDNNTMYVYFNDVVSGTKDAPATLVVTNKEGKEVYKWTSDVNTNIARVIYFTFNKQGGSPATQDIASGEYTATLKIGNNAPTTANLTLNSVTINKADGTQGAQTTTYYVNGAKITLPDSLTKTNSVFTGWKDDKGATVAAGEKTVTADVTYTAQWDDVRIDKSVNPSLKNEGGTSVISGVTATVTEDTAKKTGVITLTGSIAQPADNTGTKYKLAYTTNEKQGDTYKTGTLDVTLKYVSNKVEATVTGDGKVGAYTYTVNATALKVLPANVVIDETSKADVEKTQVTVTGTTESELKTALANTTGKFDTQNDVLSEKLSAEADKLSNATTKTALLTEAQSKAGSSGTPDTAYDTIAVVPVLQIEQANYNGTDKTMTLEITPAIQYQAIDADNTSKPAVPVGNPVALSKTDAANIGPVTITFAKPAFVTATPTQGTSKLYVTHKASTGTYEYDATWNGTAYAFENPHGFSEFVVSETSNAVASIGTGDSLVKYMNIQDAVNAVANNGTITILKELAGNDAVVTISGKDNKTVNFVLSNDLKTANKTVTLKVNGSDVPVGSTGNKFEYTYKEPENNNGGGGGVSSNVTIDRPTNGKISVTPTAPSKGATVTINLTPDTGYAVGTVTVTDKDGKAVELTKVSDTKYTFTMPDGKVKVAATFTKVDTPPATGFTDVPADAYYADAVKWAVDKGITNGLTATTFGPNNSCTRGQMVTFLWRAAGSPAVTGTNSFSDVASGEYYYNAVLWAVEKGITNGTSATTFSPNATVNRGQTVTFLYRYAESPAATGDTSFTDVVADAFYADAVKWAVAEGITNGTSDTTFAPASNCTRGQIVTFLYRQMAE